MKTTTVAIATIITAATLLIAPQAAQAVTPTPQPVKKQGVTLTDVRFERSTTRTIARRKPPTPQPPTTNPTPQPPVTPPSTNGNDFTGWSTGEIDLFTKVNTDRKAAGVAPVTTGPTCLHEYVQTRAKAMLAQGVTAGTADAFDNAYPALPTTCLTKPYYGSFGGGYNRSYTTWAPNWRTWIEMDRVKFYAPGLAGGYYANGFVMTTAPTY